MNISATSIDETLEAATADFFWVPAHVRVIDRSAINYASSTVAGYNRVVRVRPALEDPQALVDEVLEAHAGGSSLWHLNAMSDTPAMREALIRAGYVEGDMHGAYAIDTSSYARRPTGEIDVLRVETLDDLRALYEVHDAVFGADREISPQDLARELEACTGPRPRVNRFIAFRSGEPAGIGSMTFFDELDICLIWAGAVIEAHRSQGVYTALLAARAAASAERRITRLGLYARVDTSAPIVEAQGFERHGHMVNFHKQPT